MDPEPLLSGPRWKRAAPRFYWIDAAAAFLVLEMLFKQKSCDTPPKRFATAADANEFLRRIKGDPRWLRVHGAAFQSDVMPDAGQKNIRSQCLESRLLENGARCCSDSHIHGGHETAGKCFIVVPALLLDSGKISAKLSDRRAGLQWNSMSGAFNL